MLNKWLCLLIVVNLTQNRIYVLVPFNKTSSIRFSPSLQLFTLSNERHYFHAHAFSAARLGLDELGFEMETYKSINATTISISIHPADSAWLEPTTFSLVYVTGLKDQKLEQLFTRALTERSWPVYTICYWPHQTRSIYING